MKTGQTRLTFQAGSQFPPPLFAGKTVHIRGNQLDAAAPVKAWLGDDPIDR